eukprot:g16255.t1
MKACVSRPQSGLVCSAAFLAACALVTVLRPPLHTEHAAPNYIVFVLSVADHGSWRANNSRQLCQVFRDAGRHCDLWHGVDARQPTTVASLQVRGWVNAKGLSRKEYALALSHVWLWEHALAEVCNTVNNSILILEDDALLSDTANIERLLKTNTARWDVITLYTKVRGRRLAWDRVAVSPGLFRSLAGDHTSGTVALLYRCEALAYLRARLPVRGRIDMWLGWQVHPLHNFRFLAAIPNVVNHP